MIRTIRKDTTGLLVTKVQQTMLGCYRKRKEEVLRCLYIQDKNWVGWDTSVTLLG